MSARRLKIHYKDEERRHNMSVTIKSEHEIELMREAGRILSIVHQEMEKIIRPGISTMDINRKGEEVIRSYDCIPSFLNYQDTRHPSVYPSTMRSFMAFLIRRGSCRRAISSVLMRVLFIRGIIPMLPERMQSDRFPRRTDVSSM